jgi:hypothetical protein
LTDFYLAPLRRFFITISKLRLGSALSILMTPEEEAYEEALRRIREAEETAAVELNLSFSGLNRLPPELEQHPYSAAQSCASATVTKSR